MNWWQLRWVFVHWGDKEDMGVGEAAVPPRVGPSTTCQNLSLEAEGEVSMSIVGICFLLKEQSSLSWYVLILFGQGWLQSRDWSIGLQKSNISWPEFCLKCTGLVFQSNPAMENPLCVEVRIYKYIPKRDSGGAWHKKNIKKNIVHNDIDIVYYCMVVDIRYIVYLYLIYIYIFIYLFIDIYYWTIHFSMSWWIYYDKTPPGSTGSTHPGPGLSIAGLVLDPMCWLVQHLSLKPQWGGEGCQNGLVFRVHRFYVLILVLGL